MKIGRIVYSQTGNTLSVAKKLEEKLSAAGHEVTIEHLKAVGEVAPGAKDVQFESVPSLEGYDALVCGAPVHAFSLAPAMSAFMAQLPSLDGMDVALIITQHFPYGWMGGNRAMRQFAKHCEAAGANVCGSGVVNCSNKRREEMIVEVTDRLAAAL